jgi:hypothetical protein
MYNEYAYFDTTEIKVITELVNMLGIVGIMHLLKKGHTWYTVG